MRVTAAIDAMPSWLGRATEFAACVAGLAIAAALAWSLIEMSWLSGIRGSTSATVIRTPLVYPQSLAAAGAALLFLQCAAQLMRLIRGERLTTGKALD